MRTTSRTWTGLLALLALLFAIVGTINAVNKGGDAVVFFEGGRRFLHAEPLYAGSSAADGFIGPPFQALFFAPFAAVAAAWSPVAARLLWHALNLVCLGAGVWLSVKTWDAVRLRMGLSARAWLPMLFAPLVAILLPAQTNFEHQNMNALLLALLAAATWQLTLGSTVIAGVLIGTATALKAFPALLILYLAARRYWAAAIAATVSAFVLTVVLPVAVYGAGFPPLVQDFWRLGNSGWPIRGNNQSLIAAIDRMAIGFSATGFDRAGVRVAGDAPTSILLFAGLAVLLATTLIVILVRTTRRQTMIPCELAAVTVLAILLSPIAWDHYWTLMFPAFLILYESGDERWPGRMGRVAFWAAAILTTGLSPLTLGKSGFSMARELSVYTIAALIIYGGLIAVCARLAAERGSTQVGQKASNTADGSSR